MLLVKVVRQRQRNLPQLVASAVQRLTAELEHTTQAAAVDLALRDFVGTVAAVVTQGQAGRIAAGRYRRHLVGRTALHQGQAVGE
ncbi:hypothetical protein D3C79_871270 [compost metagenome]